MKCLRRQYKRMTFWGRPAILTAEWILSAICNIWRRRKKTDFRWRMRGILSVNFTLKILTLLYLLPKTDRTALPNTALILTTSEIRRRTITNKRKTTNGRHIRGQNSLKATMIRRWRSITLRGCSKGIWKPLKRQVPRHRCLTRLFWNITG